MNIGEMAALQVDRPAPLESEPSEEPSSLHRVLVPLDGSSLAEAIIPSVSRIARPLNLEIILLRVVPALPPQVIEGGRPIVIDNTERLRVEAQDYLRHVASGVSMSGLHVSTAVRVGDAPAEILAATREGQADLIAMTTHGRGVLGQLLFGSVAEAVLHRAEVPVFLLRVAESARAKKVA